MPLRIGWDGPVRALPSRLVFTRAEARELGWSDSALTRAVRAGRLYGVRRGVFTSIADLDPILAARAACRSCAGSVISHRSAALLWGLPLLDPPPPRPDLTVEPEGTGDVVAALLHRARLSAHDVTVLGGVPVTTVPRTLIDLSRSVRVMAAVVTIDAALHRRLTTTTELDSVIAGCTSWPNIRRAVRAIGLCDARSESPLESVSRVTLPRIGIAIAQPQARIFDATGRLLGRCDFYWDEFGVFGEADGRGKYDDRSVLTDEKERQERLEDIGLVGVRWGWIDVRNRPQALAARLRNAFERGRRRDASGFPRGWSVRPT